MGFTVSQIGDCLKEEFQDLVILAQYTRCPKLDLGCIHPFLSPYDFNSDLEGCYKEGLYENLNGKAYGSENALQKEEILDIGHPVC